MVFITTTDKLFNFKIKIYLFLGLWLVLLQEPQMKGATLHIAPQGVEEGEESGGHPLPGPCGLVEGVGYWGQSHQWAEPAGGRQSLDQASLHDLQVLRYCETKKIIDTILTWHQ